MEEHIIEFATLIKNKEDRYWYVLKPDIERIFGSNDIENLLVQFENSVESFEKKSKPEFTLMFFIALMILYDTQDKYSYLIKRTDNKEYLKYLKAGIRKYIQGKSSSFRYKHDLSYEDYKNPYEFVHIFSGYLPNYEMQLRGFLNVLEFFLYKNQESFFEILSVDVQNTMTLTAVLNSRVNLRWDYLADWLINSEDELKQNVGLYYILSKGDRLARISYDDRDEKELQDYLEQLKLFLKSLDEKKVSKLLLNYQFSNKKSLTVTYEYFKVIDAQDLIEYNLKDRKISLFEICVLNDICKYIQSKEALEELISEKFFKWLRFNCNEYIWDKYKENLLLIINSLKEKLNIELCVKNISDNLYVSDFDREIRYRKYLQDVTKLKVINDINTSLTKESDKC